MHTRMHYIEERVRVELVYCNNWKGCSGVGFTTTSTMLLLRAQTGGAVITVDLPSPVRVII